MLSIVVYCYLLLSTVVYWCLMLFNVVKCCAAECVAVGNSVRLCSSVCACVGNLCCVETSCRKTTARLPILRLIWISPRTAWAEPKQAKHFQWFGRAKAISINFPWQAVASLYTEASEACPVPTYPHRGLSHTQRPSAASITQSSVLKVSCPALLLHLREGRRA